MLSDRSSEGSYWQGWASSAETGHVVHRTMGRSPLRGDMPACRGWGYDGLEIACWGDHFDVVKAVEDDGYLRGAETSWNNTDSVAGRSPIISMARLCVRRSSTPLQKWSIHASGVMVNPRAFASGPPRR